MWLSGRKVDLPEEEVRAAQLVLRRFVGVVKADGISAVSVFERLLSRGLTREQMDGVSVVEHLVKSTVDADEELASVTIRLYRNFLEYVLVPCSNASDLSAARLSQPSRPRRPRTPPPSSPSSSRTISRCQISPSAPRRLTVSSR